MSNSDRCRGNEPSAKLNRKMNTTIEIKISDLGNNVGTLGWLLAQPLKITIGKTKDGEKTGAWLFIGDKQESVAFLGFKHCRWMGFTPCNGIAESEILRDSQEGEYEHTLAFGIQFTDAAWSKVEELADLAREQFRSAVASLASIEATAERTTFSVAAQPRPAGLYAGQITIAPDFND